MAAYLKAVVVAAVGVALGLAATFFSVERGFGFGAVRAGPWVGWPKTGSSDADPYARAVLARTGEMPLGTSEGLSFFARADSGGALLDPRCDYAVTGAVPPARYWTMTTSTPDGYLIDNAARRFGFSSSEVTRRQDGSFSIVVAASARSGDWLPVSATGPFVLVLRLFDTSVGASASSLDADSMPSITRTGCS